MAGVGRCHRRVSGRCTRPGSQPCPTPSWAARQRPLVPVRVAGRCDPERSAPGRCSPRTGRLRSPAPRVAQRRRGRLELPRSRTGSSRCQRHRGSGGRPGDCPFESAVEFVQLLVEVTDGGAAGGWAEHPAEVLCPLPYPSNGLVACDRENLGRRGHGLVELLCLREGDGQAEQQYGAACCRPASVVTLDAESRLTKGGDADLWLDPHPHAPLRPATGENLTYGHGGTTTSTTPTEPSSAPTNRPAPAMPLSAGPPPPAATPALSSRADCHPGCIGT